MTAVGLIIAGLGLLLVWSAVKGEDPRQVIVAVLRGER